MTSTFVDAKPEALATNTSSRLQSLAAIPRRAPRRRRRALFPDEPATWVVITTVVAIIVALLVGWELLASLGVIDTFFWSKPSLIWNALIIQLTAGTIADDIAFTATSTALGFVIGVGGGAVIGLSFWWSRFYARVAEPIMVSLEAMPKLALAPMVVLAFGLGLPSKVFMATAIVIIIQILNAYSAVRRVDRDEQVLLYSLGATRWQTFAKVVVPSTLPAIINSFRVAIGLALTGAIVGEYIGAEKGLGKLIQIAATTYDISLIWVGIFTLAVLAFVLYILVAVVERMLLRLVHG
jgi:NitT/TauT family transport system permease protein